MEDWQVKPLASVCDVFADGDWIESKDQSDAGIRLIQTGNVGEGQFKDRAEKARFISPATFSRLRCTAIFPGDCLISRLPDPVGRACIVPDTGEPMITAVDCTIVRFKKDAYLADFFTYYSQSSSYLNAVDAETTGTTRKRISRARLGQVAVPVPPPAEQRRIVAVLDEAFEAIATAKANTEKNLQNAREVFEANLEAAFCQQGPGWKQERLQDICTLYNGRAYNKDELLPAGKYPVLRVGNFFTSKHWYYSDLELDEHKYCDSGDLLYAWSASFGPRIWDGGKVIFHYHIWKVVPRADRVERDYLKYLLDWDTEKIKAAQGTGTTMMHVGKGSMDARVLPVPPLPAQRLIVTKLDALSQEVKQLSDQLTRKIVALDELKKSLLHQAFTGVLTAKTTDQQLAEVA